MHVFLDLFFFSAPGQSHRCCIRGVATAKRAVITAITRAAVAPITMKRLQTKHTRTQQTTSIFIYHIYDAFSFLSKKAVHGAWYPLLEAEIQAVC